MMYILPSYVLILIAVIGVAANYAIANKKHDDLLFRLFEKRDELALLAMKSKTLQYSDEYKIVMQSVNIQIHFVNNDLSATQFLKVMLKSMDEEKKDTELDSIYDKIKENDDLCRLHIESFEIFGEYWNKKMMLFINLILKPLNFLMKVWIFILKKILKSDKRTDELSEKVKIYDVDRATKAIDSYKQHIAYCN